MSLLDVRNLAKAYGGASVLNNVNFTLQKGEAVGIVGDNCAGKSTLLKCLSGALKPDAGIITFTSVPLRLGNPAAIRAAGIEMVYQDLALCPQQSVVANLLLGREITTTWGMLNHAAMHQVGIAALGRLNAHIPMDASVGDLSGGQRQAVAIARAMLGNPKLVILDEPTAALGLKESANVVTFIQSLTRQGIAVIMVSHHLQDILATTSRLLLMRHGQIAKVMATENLTAAQLAEEISTPQPLLQ
jgi:ABC-type sugar transport system ATPase subunit